MSVLEYLWILCHRPFKRSQKTADSDIYKLMSALASVFEKIRSNIYFVRRQFFIATCDETSLIEFGQAYNIPKFPTETVEQYRDRLLAMWDYFRLGGTIPGMLNAFEAMGYPSAEVDEHYRTMGSDGQAIFTVEVPLEEWQQGTYTRSDMQDVIRRLKPAHTLGAFRRMCAIYDSEDSLVDIDILCQ